ncbi:MAG: hypothetical protein L3J39_09075 [Verrucomicrobiales bacterium]|nr:hypothetical protein [Verrucomicrobiales bacterium]
MKTDFEFKESIYLIHGECELDLHNQYDFTGVKYSIAERRVVLTWRRSVRSGVSSSMPHFVRIKFCAVSKFQFLPRSVDKPFTEDDCLLSAGYWTGEDGGIGVVAIEGGVDSNWGRAFEFMSGAVILVKAEQGQVELEW